MEDIFANPFWHALKTEQAGIAIGSELARRYPADVIPFAALEVTSPQAMTALRDLMEPGEKIYVVGDQLPVLQTIEHLKELPCWQMHFTAKTSIDLPPTQPDDVQPRALSASDVPDMVALTNVAFPGFFRTRTYQLGRYYGIHIDGELVAMAGERTALPDFREISAVCTHPAHTGKGYAATLIRHILRAHFADGLRSFLHVAAVNERAVGLYERIGFVKTRSILVHQLLSL
jgi:ribosomal protein S18 acetylase RimI-like enzyme